MVAGNTAFLLLASAVIGFVAINVPWLHTIATPPHNFPAHWVRARQSGAATQVAPPLCFDIDDRNTTQRTMFCEDAKMLHGPALDGWAMFSCDAGRAEWNTVMGPLRNPSPRGALWIYPYARAAYSRLFVDDKYTPSATMVPLHDFPAELDFHPLGFAVRPISMLPSGSNGEARLFVVNHRRDRAAIEVFDLRVGVEERSWSAHYVRSLVHPVGTHTPNSVVVLSDTELLVTQDHAFALHPAPPDQLRQMYAALFGPSVAGPLTALASSKVGRTVLPRIETLLGLRLSFVSYVRFDDEGGAIDATIVARRIAFANGIAQSPNRRVIAVASTTMPGVRLYALERSSDTGADVRLTPLDAIYTPNLADNIGFSVPNTSEASDDGDTFGSDAVLVAAGGTSGPQLIAFARNPRNYAKASPSWVVAIQPKKRAAGDTIDDDALAAFPARKRLLKAHANYTVKTLYQGRRPSPRDPPYKNKHMHIGVASSSSAAYDASVGQGALLVSGLYSTPGVMMCFHVGQE